MEILVRRAREADLESIRQIYNQGIADRIATLESEPKDETYMRNWFSERSERYSVLVAEDGGKIVGWVSINPYSHRCAYRGVGDISIYIHRDHRGQKIGQRLLGELEQEAIHHHFHKLVLFTFPFNQLGQGLYHKCGYREVGIFQKQGLLDGRFIDIMAMEKLINAKPDE